LKPRVFEQLLRGFATACRENHCALIGGETAQMPGFYQDGEYDLSGTIVGVVEKAAILDGKSIRRATRSSDWPPAACTPTAIRWREKFLCADEAAPAKYPPRTERQRIGRIAQGSCELWAFDSGGPEEIQSRTPGVKSRAGPHHRRRFY
jgi:hypothetical protein